MTIHILVEKLIHILNGQKHAQPAYLPVLQGSLEIIGRWVVEGIVWEQPNPQA